MARDTYTKVHEDWQNDPSTDTPIMAEDMEHIEAGIKTAMDSRALKEIYGDQSIRLSVLNDDPTPLGKISLEMGVKAKATKDFTVAIGNNAEATEQNAVSIGSNTKSNHDCAFVTGLFTKSSRVNQLVGGMYNADDPNAVFILGFGFGEDKRENIHTVDYQGNAYFKGDVANGQYSLNALGEKLGGMVDNTVDVTEDCVLSITGQTLEVIVPLSLIMSAYGYYIVGGEFIGAIYYDGIPPMLFNLQISAVKDGEVHGRSVLTNLIASTTATYGYKFDGSIELLFANSWDTPKAKVTFDLGREGTVRYSTIFRTAGSAIDFTISELRGEELTYEETMAILNEEEEA